MYSLDELQVTNLRNNEQYSDVLLIFAYISKWIIISACFFVCKNCKEAEL